MAIAPPKRITEAGVLAEAVMAMHDAQETAIETLLDELGRCGSLDEPGALRVRLVYSQAMGEAAKRIMEFSRP